MVCDLLSGRLGLGVDFCRCPNTCLVAFTIMVAIDAAYANMLGVGVGVFGVGRVGI